MKRLLIGLVLTLFTVSTVWAQVSRRVEIQYYSDAKHVTFYPDSTVTIFYDKDGLELSREVVTREEFMAAVMDSIWVLTASPIAEDSTGGVLDWTPMPVKLNPSLEKAIQHPIKAHDYLDD